MRSVKINGFDFDACCEHFARALRPSWGGSDGDDHLAPLIERQGHAWRFGVDVGENNASIQFCPWCGKEVAHA